MIKNGLDEFMSVHLFPAGNTYQANTALAYQKTIKLEMQSTFKPVTYEQFIATGLEIFKRKEERNWLAYLEERYIVK
jgi:hypothetical protein